VIDVLEILGRTRRLFSEDVEANEPFLTERVKESRFLVVGGAGSIGQALVKEIFSRTPRALHVVDLSENNLAELVRDLRSSLGYIEGDFRTFAVDFGQPEFQALCEAEGPYDYFINVSALKHVRSERDPFTLMRLLQVNVVNTVDFLEKAVHQGAKKVFCVSSDKAVRPANLMGASKRIMELFLADYSKRVPISTARFANVAFSDGSLLHAFRQRLNKNQPLSAPLDVLRYFIDEKEAGQLCLLSTVLGQSGDIFFPKLSGELKLTSFISLAERFLKALGYEPLLFSDEEEARRFALKAPRNGKWPLYVFESDTTGEKEAEEFYSEGEEIDLNRFKDVGVIRAHLSADPGKLKDFLTKISSLRQSGTWSKDQIKQSVEELVPELDHKEKGKHLDDRM